METDKVDATSNKQELVQAPHQVPADSEQQRQRQLLGQLAESLVCGLIAEAVRACEARKANSSAQPAPTATPASQPAAPLAEPAEAGEC